MTRDVDFGSRDLNHLDEELNTILVGGLEPRKVVIAEYDPGWPLRFELEKSRLWVALENAVLRIEHVGSTAVPGLAAKPVVDILLVVADVDAESSYRPAIEALGFELRVDEPGHRAFRTLERDVNLHVYEEDDEEIAAYLLFRDRLRNEPADRLLYEEKKRELAEREWRDINYYADAKSTVVEEILERARGSEAG